MYQLTDADISNITLLLRQLKQIISEDEFDQLEGPLIETNYFAKKVTVEKNDALWNFCIKSINYVFESADTGSAIQIVQTCMSLEGLYRAELDTLERLKEKLLEIESENDNTSIELLKADFYAKQGDLKKAVQLLEEYISQNKLTKKDKYTVN